MKAQSWIFKYATAGAALLSGVSALLLQLANVGTVDLSTNEGQLGALFILFGVIKGGIQLFNKGQ